MTITITLTDGGTFVIPPIGGFANSTTAIVCSGQTANVLDPRTEETLITDLHEEGYALLKPIPITIERIDDADYLASFKEANIAISGSDSQDAFQSLVAEILDTFDSLSEEEENLGRDAAAQFDLLKGYVVKA